jgi:DNA-binding PadR family transcriptional regulator
MPPPSRDPASFLPVSPLDFQVLALLAAHGALHGYGIVSEAATAFPEQPLLDIGSLYRIIARLVDREHIEEVPAPQDAPKDRHVRRYYSVTELGRAVARAEAARLRALLASPATLRLIKPIR